MTEIPTPQIKGPTLSDALIPLLLLIAMLAMSVFLFGSDSSFFPRGWNTAVLDVQRGILQDLGVSEEHAGAILGGNLRRLMTG